MENDLDELVTTMAEIWRFIRKQSQSSLINTATTFLQLNALRFISENDKITTTQLSEFLHVSLSSTTQLVERLVKTGLVKRVDDTKDRRVIRLSITLEGSAEIKRFKEERRIHMKQVFSQIPAKDLKELLRIQKNLLSQLQERA
ncbi:MAG: MarR family transcriptional regulator [Patescibacteria group bacterium]|nr:MarR family transcriptional regulator [Patescibacteria group bacterium]